MSRAAGEAERRRRARARKTQSAAAPTTGIPLRFGLTLDEDCPDRENHDVCPVSGGKHDWYKPHPRPADHKYECAECGHYDLDDYM